MPRIPSSPTTVALVLYRAWFTLPPKQRRQLVDAARTHGPRLAAKAATATTRAASAGAVAATKRAAAARRRPG